MDGLVSQYLSFCRICNSTALSIRIFNPIIALQMLMFVACELQIRTNKVYNNTKWMDL